MAEFQDRIRELRLEKNMNQVQFADLFNWNRQKVADMERGKTSPNADTLIKLSKYFNVSTDYLLGVSEYRTQETTIKDMCNYTGLSEQSIQQIANGWDYNENLRVAMYADELEDVQFIENQIARRNVLFEISHRIYEISLECYKTITNLDIGENDYTKITNDLDAIKRCKNQINGILYGISLYLSDIARIIYQEHSNSIEKLDKILSGYLVSSDKIEQKEIIKEYIDTVKKYKEKYKSQLMEIKGR